MTTVGRLQQILAQIRSSLASKADAQRTSRSAGRGAPTRSALTDSRPTVEELKAQISGGLTAADLASPQGRQQARRVFLESVLLAEFGAALANDARFAEIVSGVQESFEHEPSLLAELDSVLEELRQNR